MFELIDYYDVWGNSADGWEVNNLATVARDIVITDDATQRDIMECLKRIGYFAKHVRLNMLDFSMWETDMIEISRRRDGQPLCSLRRQWDGVRQS